MGEAASQSDAVQPPATDATAPLFAERPTEPVVRDALVLGVVPLVLAIVMAILLPIFQINQLVA